MKRLQTKTHHLMNRNIINLAAIGLCTWLLVGCVSTGSNSKSQGPGLAPATPAYSRSHSRLENQPWKNTPFSTYDSALVAAIEKRWYDILDIKAFKPDITGKVVVRFHLHHDGTMSDINILENQTNALLGDACERAIKDCSPFNRWPTVMARMVGREYREITFTFYYY
jgi:TonB family protein